MATFIATTASETFNGTADASDTVDFSADEAAAQGININLSYTTPQSLGAWGTDTFVSIENVIGTRYRDVVFALNGGTHTLSLGAGDDEFLTGGGGVWQLDGGEGDDYWGADYGLITTGLTLIYNGLAKSGTLSNGSSFSGMEEIGVNFSYGDDIVLLTTPTSALVHGSYGNDTFTITGFKGLNNIFYGGGVASAGQVDTDVLTLDMSGMPANNNSSFISGSPGVRGMSLGISDGEGGFSASEFEVINYVANAGDNRVVVNGVSSMTNGAGLTVNAGAGNDELILNLVDNSDVRIVIQNGQTIESNIGTFNNFESFEIRLGGGANFVRTGDTADWITSHIGQDTVYGGGGNDLIYFATSYRTFAQTYFGEGGNDTLRGGVSTDLLDGGDGQDILDAYEASDTLRGAGGADVMNGGAGSDRLEGGAGNDTMRGEDDADLLFGEDGADSLTGGYGDDVIYGQDGNDMLFGESGHDTVVGGAGLDVLYGQDGNDHLAGEDSNDTVHGGKGLDTVIGGAGEDSIYGEDDTDIVYGESGHDLVAGGHGNDTLFGQADNDTLYGEMGDDLIVGGQGADMVYGQEGGDVLFAEDGDDFAYGGVGHDRLYGQAGNDMLQGEAGDDLLDGGVGGDFLVGGAGADDLTGGAGPDVFYFDSRFEMADRVYDFSHADGDRLVFKGSEFNVPAGFTLTAGVGLLQGAGVTPVAQTATFCYDTNTRALWYDVDGTGGAGATVIAFLLNTPTLDVTDFVFT